MPYHTLMYDLSIEEVTLDNIRRLVDREQYNPNNLYHRNFQIIDACVRNCNYVWTGEILKYLLTVVDNPSKNDLLITAISNDENDFASILIDAGVDVNYKNSAGITAVQLAAHYNEYDLVGQLIKAGVVWQIGDTNHLEWNGETIKSMHEYIEADNVLKQTIVDNIHKKTELIPKVIVPKVMDLNVKYAKLVKKDVKKFISTHTFEVEI